MNKVAHYLQEHLVGEVFTDTDARLYFATDASIFKVTPSFVVYPRTENDVRKAARFSWQLAERGRILPITARGSGTDVTGAALGNGVMLVFPAHMNRILELDSKTGLVIVEPGLNYGKLQQALHTHGRFLPPYPASLEYSTIGGAVANNASGEKSFKYGATRDFVKGLRVVLANGEVIETKRLSKRELNKKMGLATFEGEIYRSLDALLEEHKDIIKQYQPNVTKNAAGFALDKVKRKDGSFDLTPLVVGSQGTLGIVTEVSLETEQHTAQTTIFAAMLDDLSVADQILTELRKLSDGPSVLEFVDQSLLEFIRSTNPNLLKNVFEEALPKLMLIIELDNPSERNQKRAVKKVAKILSKYQISFQQETEPQRREDLWKIRQSAGSALIYAEGANKPVPAIEDGIVPVERFGEYIQAVQDLFGRYGVGAAMWGHAGDANIHLQPLFDISQIGGRQQLFKLMDEYYQLVIGMGGSITAQHNDGRLRGPFLEKQYGAQVYELFSKAKQIFDPYGTLNPGVKVGVSLADVKPLLRDEYSLKHLYDHLPRS